MTSSGSTEIESKIRQLSLWLEGRLLDWEVTYTNGSQDFTVSTGVRLNDLRSVADTYTVKQDMGFHREIRYECVSEAGKPKQLSLL